MPKLIEEPAPYWVGKEGRAELWLGHVIPTLEHLPSGVVQTCVTSPPYWGLRDYGTGKWEGGSASCDHVEKNARNDVSPQALARRAALYKTGQQEGSKVTPMQFKGQCKKCGAVRTDQQLGAEPSPDCGTQGQAQCGKCFVCNMVAVFRGVHRVLRDDGTLWLNLGDSYSNTGLADPSKVGGFTGERIRAKLAGNNPNDSAQDSRKREKPLPSGNLVGIPWRVALALQADGWILRQDIIWHKPNPMPESVTNRCTKAHEYVFLFSKSEDYYYDAEPIKEPAARAGQMPGGKKYSSKEANANIGGAHTAKTLQQTEVAEDKNRRSVWTQASAPYKGAHFATFPPKLIEPMILAGTSEAGCCPRCRTPWQRVVEKTKLLRDRPNDYVKRTGEEGTGNSCGNTVAGVSVETVGWEPTCRHKYNDDLEPIPCTVLDPFIGSGTTIGVANRNGRAGIGIDLNEDYLRDQAIKRIEAFR